MIQWFSREDMGHTALHRVPCVPVKLEPQASKILSLLLEYPGKICTRQQLQQHLWQDNTLVDFERSLYKGIHTLRGTLGDSATAPRYIETVTGRGYRFIPIPQEPSNHRGRRRNGCKVGSVAVLPFASESADAEMELLNRRIIERVIDTMSRAPGVRVLAYNTVQHQRGKDLDSRSLGENLLVNAIAVGEMIRHNDELLLHVELIDVCDGSQLWGQQFKEHYSDVLQEPEALGKCRFRSCIIAINENVIEDYRTGAYCFHMMLDGG